MTVIKNTVFGLLCFASAVLHLDAAAPERITAALFQVRGVGTSPRLERVEQTYPYALFEDGTYVGIYNGETGRWIYERIDAATAVITRSTPLGPVPDTLTFTSDTRGTYSRPSSSLLENLSFELRPFTGRSRLMNSSCRVLVRPGDRAVVGFVVAEPGGMALVRAVGPGLTQFGVANVLAAPVLVVRRADGTEVARNAGWTAPDVLPPGFGRSPSEASRIRSVSAFVGAFPLPDGSLDSAVHWMADGGNYVAEVTSSNTASSGEVLIEVYVFP